MIVLLVVLVFGINECKILSVNPKYSYSKRAIQINGNLEIKSQERSRNKRQAVDDHGSDWNDKIAITKV